MALAVFTAVFTDLIAFTAFTVFLAGAVAAFGLTEAAFGLTEAAFGETEAAFGLAEAAFGETEAAFGLAEAAFGLAEAAFGLAEAVAALRELSRDGGGAFGEAARDGGGAFGEAARDGEDPPPHLFTISCFPQAILPNFSLTYLRKSNQVVGTPLDCIGAADGTLTTSILDSITTLGTIDRCDNLDGAKGTMESLLQFDGSLGEQGSDSTSAIDSTSSFFLSSNNSIVFALLLTKLARVAGGVIGITF